jgi:NitT/TauT family transport system substrate-binding protein
LHLDDDLQRIWPLLDAGMKPSELVVFRYDDQGVAVLEDGLYVLQPRSPIRRRWTGSPVSCAPRSRVGATAMLPRIEDETVAIVLRNASPGMTDPRAPQRMLRRSRAA